LEKIGETGDDQSRNGDRVWFAGIITTAIPIELGINHDATDPTAVTRLHLHLVSDSTGETVHSVARACLVQFDDVQAVEHVWSMVRTRNQIDRVIAGVEANPGIVLFTLVSDQLRQLLQQGCRRLQIPAIPILDPVIAVLASHLHRESRGVPGKQHLLDSEYFARIDAMTFAYSLKMRAPARPEPLPSGRTMTRPTRRQ
jgi:hypothetical protein